MKITSSILSIPPYISTTWERVASLHADENQGLFSLIITLKDDTRIEVPNLENSVIQSIFETYEKLADKNTLERPVHFNLPIKTSGVLENFESALNHNPDLANLPPLPPEVLTKISTVVKAFDLDKMDLPKAEPHCNCVYCQVTRAITGNESPIEEDLEEVTDEDLTFRDWEIQQVDKELYTVTNPLDEAEKYTVFLGTPIGCNCGSKNCEHIRAVLSS